MTLSNDKSSLRDAFLSVLLAILLLTTGCSGFLSDAGNDPGESRTATDEPHNFEEGLTPANGTDLRTISIPDEGSTTKSGELDGGDPIKRNAAYEPVQFTAESGTVVNITMRTDGGEPTMRLVNPNGSVVDIAGTDGSGTARFSSIGLSETGQYTIEATSFYRNTTFEYSLTIEENDRLFAGPMSTWNETEKYLEFGQDFAYTANQTADTGQFYRDAKSEYLRANTTTDILIIGYQWDPEGRDLNTTQRIDMDVAIRLTYKNLYDAYANNFSSDPDLVEDESWVPEVIYFYAETPDGELYRTNFLELRWAKEFIRTQDLETYYGRYYSTNLYGPASPSYLSEGGPYSTTEEEFPYETYENFTYPDGTTHGERYYETDNGTER